jgi:hypothetical protein
MKQLITLFLAGLIMTCSHQMPRGISQTADEKSKVKMRVAVQLDIFSGKENPAWQLSEEDSAALVKILDQLPGASPNQFFDGLGYRGFLVTLTEPESGTTNELKVYQGKVRYGTGKKARFLVDSRRQLERLLLKTGKSHLVRADYEYVESEVLAP